MALIDIVMPQLGESIAEGTIARWLKAVGDTVAEDEPLLEVSTDKVDAEIPSVKAGRIAEIRGVGVFDEGKRHFGPGPDQDVPDLARRAR